MRLVPETLVPSRCHMAEKKDKTKHRCTRRNMRARRLGGFLAARLAGDLSGSDWDLHFALQTSILIVTFSGQLMAGVEGGNLGEG